MYEQNHAKHHCSQSRLCTQAVEDTWTSLNVEQLAEQLAGWKQKLYAFTDRHACHGAQLAKCIVDGLRTSGGDYVPGLGQLSSTTAHDLALDIAWIFWLDDCFDSSPDSSSNLILTLGDFELDDETRPLEVWSAARVRAGLRVGPRPEAAWDLWMNSVVEMTQAFQRNKRFSRSGVHWTYAEYIDNGEISSAVPHFMATVSLVYKLDMHELVGSSLFGRMLRHLSLAMRLENDLVSYAKELEEGDQANSVLIMSELVGLERALEFIEQQRMGHERMVLSAIAEFGPSNMLARAARLILEGAHWFHAIERERYRGAPKLVSEANSGSGYIPALASA